jgi:hypothetical protein
MGRPKARHQGSANLQNSLARAGVIVDFETRAQHSSPFWRGKFRLYSRRSLMKMTVKLTSATARAVASGLVIPAPRTRGGACKP